MLILTRRPDETLVIEPIDTLAPETTVAELFEKADYAWKDPRKAGEDFRCGAGGAFCGAGGSA